MTQTTTEAPQPEVPDELMTNPHVAGVQRMLIQGVPVDRITLGAVISLTAAVIEDRRQISVMAVNPEQVVRARQDPALLTHLHRSDILIPDGTGCVLAMRWQGFGVERLPGAELMPALCERAAGSGWRVFLFGAHPEANAVAAQRLIERYPALRIVGRQHGYLGPDDEAELIERINASGAELLFVATGSPRQEAWIHRNRDRLRVNVLQGIGDILDVAAGTARLGPDSWQRWKLAWLYRLLPQPRQWRRQRALLVFALRLIAERAGFAAPASPADVD
ncbi:MAG: WecB/TagA/CpsF family glycosyltransferase [Pseudomonadota bacterium]